MFEFFKKFVHRWFLNFSSFLALLYFYPGLISNGKLNVVIVAGFLLAVIQVFLDPFLKLLFLPINIITLGMFRWLIVTTHLIIVAYILDPLRFTPFTYESFKFMGFTIPGSEVNIIFSVIIASILFKFIRAIIKFLA